MLNLFEEYNQTHDVQQLTCIHILQNNNNTTCYQSSKQPNLHVHLGVIDYLV